MNFKTHILIIAHTIVVRMLLSNDRTTSWLEHEFSVIDRTLFWAKGIFILFRYSISLHVGGLELPENLHVYTYTRTTLPIDTVVTATCMVELKLITNKYTNVL